MNFFDLVNISERYMEVINPSTVEKMLAAGKYLRLNTGSRVIDFGCGFGESLALWAEEYGITGIGIEIRPYACQRAVKKMKERDLEKRIEIVCASGCEYAYPEHRFDAAVCLGASFIWGGFAQTVRALKKAVRPAGRIAIGEPYWLSRDVPVEILRKEPDFHHENELLHLARQEGFDFEYVVRSNQDDWDRYEAGNWHGLVGWIEENPNHPERQQVIDHLHASQDEYTSFGRQYFGWAIYVLAPVSY